MNRRPLTLLDGPVDGMHAEALGLADPDGPIGARGVGEPPVGASFGAVRAAIGDDMFHRAPVTADLVVSSLASGRRAHPVLTAHLLPLDSFGLTIVMPGQVGYSGHGPAPFETSGAVGVVNTGKVWV